MPDPKTGELRGNRNLKRMRRISQSKQDEEIERCLGRGIAPVGNHVKLCDNLMLMAQPNQGSHVINMAMNTSIGHQAYQM